MTAALEGGEWSAARLGRTLRQGKTWYPFYTTLDGPQGRSGRAKNRVPIGIFFLSSIMLFLFLHNEYYKDVLRAVSTVAIIVYLFRYLVCWRFRDSWYLDMLFLTLSLRLVPGGLSHPANSVQVEFLHLSLTSWGACLVTCRAFGGSFLLSSCRDSIPDRPARSQSLYRLSYPANHN